MTSRTTAAHAHDRSPTPAAPAPRGTLLRRCACGGHAGPAGECEECRRKREARTLQRGTAGPDRQPPAGTGLALRVSAPTGAAEDAADRAARSVAAGRPVALDPRAADAAATGTGFAPPVVREALAAPGRPLDSAARGFLESRFRRDFSAVRVHTDARAADSARAVGAVAYTVGRDIVFSDGAYAPGTGGGRQLLAHELAHVVQQGPAGPGGLLQRTPDPKPGPREVKVGDDQDTCEGALDITDIFRGFMKDYPRAIAAMPGLTDDQRQGYRNMLDRVLKSEDGVDPLRWTVLSCTKINLDLAVGQEKFRAYFDRAHKTIGLDPELVSELTKALRDPDAFIDVLTTLAHEKRHATLGSSVSVPLTGLKGEQTQSKAQNAGYRVEEILAVSEEIAVRRKAIGPDYEVPEAVQHQFYRLSNMMKNWVTEAEAARLRKLVIDKLRDRYGFDDGCDNALTVGVVRCMDRNEWFSCDRDHRTIYGPVPEGLHICTDDNHAFCRPQADAASPASR